MFGSTRSALARTLVLGAIAGVANAMAAAPSPAERPERPVTRRKIHLDIGPRMDESSRRELEHGHDETTSNELFGTDMTRLDDHRIFNHCAACPWPSYQGLRQRSGQQRCQRQQEDGCDRL
jgi:hypothetical protein